ncbi:MAG TPA: glucokinase [Terriglobales bacterium]|jgi:glucokinase|nr:glucokinase [Terriglobales bacterium]
MILAGDIGGTHARLAFFDVEDGRFNLVSAKIFPSREYSGLDQIVSEFLQTSDVNPDRACFGIAGPVRNGRVETSNLPWIVESQSLANELKLKKVFLINDLEANAWGIVDLDVKDAVPLNQVKGNPQGNQAVIAAGTGLGEAGMYWNGSQHEVFATEGGHADFAPRNELEVELFRYLNTEYGHVSYERILSGPGLVNVFHFLRDTGRGAEPKWLTDEMQHSDPAAAISQAAMGGKCALCEQAVDIFVSVYAAEAGNLALKTMATGGVYLGGGIAPKMLSKMSGPLFMHAFAAKGRMQPLLEAIPVRVITNDKIALVGAARYASVKAEP